MSGYQINDFLFGIFQENIFVVYQKKEHQKYAIENETILNKSLCKYLKQIKREIDLVYEKWDKVKKLTNKYEFINTYVHLDKYNFNSCVCEYKPISRSYFKLIEIMNIYQLNKDEKQINSFHLAEGPGGFIEAMVNERKNKNDAYYGFTLMEKHNDVPKWRKIQDFLRKHENIHLVYGPKGDGNLYFKHNLTYFKQNYKGKFDFVTADGGFDYSMDFNNQEQDSFNLIFCEVLYALIIQKAHGSFVLKMFDTFNINSVQILYLLSYFYKEVHVYKPKTSREANSEKYIICKDFCCVNNSNDIIEKLCENFEMIVDHQITNMFNFEINNYFISKIEEINAIYGQQQIENIMLTLNYIQEDLCSNKDKVDKIKNSNIKKCIQWCLIHKQKIHHHLQTLNVD